LKETTSEHAQKAQILEAEVAAKTEDLQRFKRLNEKQYRQLIAQEEKGTINFFSRNRSFFNQIGLECCGVCIFLSRVDIKADRDSFCELNDPSSVGRPLRVSKHSECLFFTGDFHIFS